MLVVNCQGLRCKKEAFAACLDHHYTLLTLLSELKAGLMIQFSPPKSFPKTSLSFVKKEGKKREAEFSLPFVVILLLPR
jgi:hypothetical protein